MGRQACGGCPHLRWVRAGTLVAARNSGGAEGIPLREDSCPVPGPLRCSGKCFNSGVDMSSPDGRSPGRMTVRRVAELAGVSIATVSRVINGHADVSSQTREAVQRVIRERGYPAGPRSRAARTGQIGVMVPLIHPGCFAEILAGAAEALYEHDLRAVMGPTRHSRVREMSLLERLAGGAADGAIIVLPEESSQEFAALAGHGFPFVIVDPRTEIAEGIPVVCAAHASGATQATRHLLELGHRRIAVIGGPRGWVATEARLRGYHAALAGASVLPDPVLAQYSDFGIEGGREAAARLLGLPDPPTAIFAFNDSMAVGALQAASARCAEGSSAARHRRSAAPRGLRMRRPGPRSDRSGPGRRRTLRPAGEHTGPQQGSLALPQP